MKKLFYFLFALTLFSCSSNDEETQIEDLQPDKAYLFFADEPYTPASSWHYQFTYKNGNLIKMNGKLYTPSPGTFYFDPNAQVTLTYNNNQVAVDGTTFDNIPIVYILENGKPKTAKMSYQDEYGEKVVMSKTYTYEPSKITVYSKRYDIETVTAYYFDAKNNLIKKESLEKTWKGEDNIRTTTTYTDFDNARNPFKKMYLINDTFYEKSLSANNFREKKTVYQYLPNSQNGNVNMPSGFSYNQWTYKYDSNGQLLLYYPH